MADENNEDSWLYGNSNPEYDAADGDEGKKKCPDDKLAEEEPNAEQDDQEEEKPMENPADEMEEADEAVAPNQTDNDTADAEDEPDGEENGVDDTEEDDSDDDDDINVVIGDIKSGSSYNIKPRGAGILSSGATMLDKSKQASGKFNIEEFESAGMINGVPIHEFSIDSLEEKPWRKPGADITDYFNYGFNEETWRAYCERQKKMRINETGVGLQGLAGPSMPPPSVVNRTLTPIASNDHSKYGSGIGGLNMIRRAGPPPGRKMTGVIDVIGSNGLLSRRDNESGPPAPNENVIQVMTAERREYSRPSGNMPPPGFPPPMEEQFFEPEDYGYGYEPTQEHQWSNDNSGGWQPSGIKELTPGPHMTRPMLRPPHMIMRPPMVMPPQMCPPPHMTQMNAPPRMMPPDHVMEARERDRERDRERERDRDRGRSERERGGDRERDRERDREYRERSRERIKSEERDEDSPSKERRRERERYREKGSRRDRSRSRERRRRSKSRDKERKNREKKKSHKKDKEDSE